jgi:tRNA wybutosine-synthesizing protein 1
MENVPWHEEVVDFVQQLVSRLSGYDIASEHEHSNCVLVANTKFRSSDGRWHTWIDYNKFHLLAAAYREGRGPSFTTEDYTAITPDWAEYGSSERGFDPDEERHHRNRARRTIT